MQKLSPVLWTNDLDATISFYETVLGFKAESNYPNFASVTKGNVEMMFVVPRDEPEGSGKPSDKEGFFPKPLLTGNIYIVTKEVDELWDRVKDKAVVKVAIDDRDYFMRDFSIFDNNGYELVFGQNIDVDYD